MDKIKDLELLLAAERLSSTAAIAALHLQNGSYKEQMLSQILWKQIKAFDKLSDQKMEDLL